MVKQAKLMKSSLVIAVLVVLSGCQGGTTATADETAPPAPAVPTQPEAQQAIAPEAAPVAPAPAPVAATAEQTAPAPVAAATPPNPANPNVVTLALRYVSFVDENEKPVLSTEATDRVVQQINDIYTQCKVGFKLEEYLPVKPATVGLEYGLNSMSQLNPTREKFMNPTQLVVINTGEWSGMGSANAWTTMPGTDPAGAVLEAPVATNAEIAAHELGHYLNLDHVDDQANLMNPVIYSTSRALTESQCAQVIEAARGSRAAALR